MRLGLTDEHERALRLLAVLYLKENTAMWINYMERTKAFSRWLIPDYGDYEEYYPSFSHIKDTTNTIPKDYHHTLHSYELQQLAHIWKVYPADVWCLLMWAREEIDKHAASYSQASLPFEYLASTRVPEKISTTQITRSPGRGL